MHEALSSNPIPTTTKKKRRTWKKICFSFETAASRYLMVTLFLLRKIYGSHLSLYATN
jgi:hypothetical protein